MGLAAHVGGLIAGLRAEADAVQHPDGSVDVYFGPVAPKGKESNWVQTVPGKGWNMLFRLYGPLEPSLSFHRVSSLLLV